MNAGEKQLSKVLKAVFWFVVINSVGGALSLILSPTKTETYFFWNITPPINAMLMGTLYLVTSVAVAYVALIGTWEATRVIAVMGFVIGILLVIVTLLHVDRFVPGGKLYYWLLVYMIVPILIAFLYWRFESAGASWQVIHKAIGSFTRLAALVTGVALLIVAVVGLFFPNLITGVWPWQISELMLRVFMSWLFTLGVGNLWFGVEKEWMRVRVVSYMLIATPLLVAAVMLINRADLTGNPVTLWIFSVLLALIGLTGVFMLWQQRQ
jgi:hypothetical protein